MKYLHKIDGNLHIFWQFMNNFLQEWKFLLILSYIYDVDNYWEIGSRQNLIIRNSPISFPI